MSNKVDFNELVELAIESKQVPQLRPVIEKELIHYDILFCLAEHGFLNKLTFQGGTALRLCYQSKRYSEDLDFVGGKNFSSETLAEMSKVLVSYITARYDLEVKIKKPKDIAAAEREKYVRVDKWQIAITINPGEKHLPKQRVKIEVANIPAYTRELLPITKNYNFLPDGYSDTFIAVESLDEILADKIIAYAARGHIKARDIWDLQWLLQHESELQIEFVKNKIADYHINDFAVLLKNRMVKLDEAVKSKEFYDEMSRFLDSETVSRTLDKEGFFDYLIKNIGSLLKLVLSQLEGLQSSDKFEL